MATDAERTASKRDVTRALDIVKNGVGFDSPADLPETPDQRRVAYTQAQADELTNLLTAIDARTGTRDPSQRPKRRR